LIRKLKGFLLALVPASLGAYALASILATQTILAQVQELGLPVTFRDRLHATGHDLVGLFMTYAPLILIAYLIAMPVGIWLSNRYRDYSAEFLGLAGFAAVLALHLIMKQTLGVNGIAAAREVIGLLLQSAAGAFGGFLYYVFSGRANTKSSGPTPAM